MSKIIINKLTGQQARTIDRAWWTDAAFVTATGEIGVARVEAESLTLRYSGAVGDYTQSTEHTGRPVTYMIDLTEAELAEYGLTPGILAWPTVKDGRRPRSNRTDAPVSESDQRRAYGRLQNEGA